MEIRVTITEDNLAVNRGITINPINNKDMYMVEYMEVEHYLSILSKTWNDIDSYNYVLGLSVPYHYSKKESCIRHPIDAYECIINIKD